MVIEVGQPVGYPESKKIGEFIAIQIHTCATYNQVDVMRRRLCIIVFNYCSGDDL